jgi:hypothetical protein
MGRRRYSDNKTFKNIEDYPKEDPKLIPKHFIIKMYPGENIYGAYLKLFDDGFESISFLIGSKHNYQNNNSNYEINLT